MEQIVSVGVEMGSCRGMGEESMGSGLESGDSWREDGKWSIKQGWEERRLEVE